MASDKDHEYSMARSQLSSAQKAAKRIKKKVGKGEGNLKAWVQSKITKASDYLDSTADYLDNKDVKEGFVLLPLDVEIPSSISEFNSLSALSRLRNDNPFDQDSIAFRCTAA